MLSRKNEHELCSFCRFSEIITRGPNRSEKDRHLCRWDERIRRNPSQNAAFFTKSEHTIKRAIAPSSPVSTVYVRNAWVLHRCFPVFRNINLRTAGSFGMLLLAAVTKFQGNLASLQQVSSPNSQDNFQICWANMYLVRFLANLAGFRLFLWISRVSRI